MSIETIDTEPQSYWHSLGTRLSEVGDDILDQTAGSKVSPGGRLRAADIGLPEGLDHTFEQMFELPAEGVRLNISDHSHGTKFELLVAGEDIHKKHLLFIANRNNFLIDGKDTGTGLLYRHFNDDGSNSLELVQYRDEVYQQIQSTAELFFPVLGYEFGS